MSQIVFDRKRFTCYGGATNGSFTASSETNLELISSHSSGATFDIEGYSGVTSCTISAGVYDIVIHMPQWDGTGEVSSKSNRTFHFQYAGGVTPLIVQTPAVNIDSIGAAYLGSSAVTAVYLGADLIYSGSTPPTPQQSTYLIMDISNIPSDGQVHTYTVYNDQTERMSVLEVDMGNMTVNYKDDPDGLDVSFSTSYDDKGDISQGWIRWELYGPFNGRYYIYADSIQLETAIPDYDGSEMVAYVDVATDTMTTFSCYEEWDCRQNNPTCTWNPDTKSCDCGGV